MTHVCSVILIRRSFDIYHEQHKISLHNESIVLLEKNLADDFAFCSPDTRRLDIDELTVCQYLQNIRQLPRNLGLHSKDRLLINQSPPMPLVTAIFDSFNESGVNSPILSNMLYLSCLSMFSHKKELIPLLFNSISTVSGKVERLISFDIAKRWYLRDIAERMYTSESLIKKKLQDENTCFSKILLASRMSMARRLLELRQIPLHTIAEKCGYSSTSYFINTFRQYYGVTPHQFAQHSPGTFS
ncbi:TPA: acid resistance transcriptional activator GadW [Escherichia coli]|uniref:acid resistance transcriptional activator GadW n=1 Tax=Escherichia coli TaxID=562 RepID=UPI000DA53600|nr:acid resistance transcriptional activator GadW [Escherichia coli]EFB3772376.1 acid resistance transcriptional activator GadW [Escherichia coli]EFD1775029.1 acid resistance transcriptional activator GadW [Escherichia coli]EFO1326876.1 acid resistance transcriptional activator GadW [Escherichia coli]EHW5161709.1 acid resistance transcriptional activator GadW [Escherichia coli]EJE3095218.1 acid resistance transcriptional activator GadW [Escherichia coli]